MKNYIGVKLTEGMWYEYLYSKGDKVCIRLGISDEFNSPYTLYNKPKTKTVWLSRLLENICLIFKWYVAR